MTQPGPEAILPFGSGSGGSPVVDDQGVATPGAIAHAPSDDQAQGMAISGAIVLYASDDKDGVGVGATATPEAVSPITIVPPTGSRGRSGHCRGPIRGARSRARDGVLNPDLAGLRAADLVAYLRRHHSSKYAFAKVSLVLRDRERRLRSEAEEWRRRAVEAEAVADGLRGELSAAADAEVRLQAEVEEWRRKAAEAEAVADGLRGEISRARELSLSAAAAEAATEARLRAEVDEWRRKAVEAAEVLDGLSGVRAEFRARELSAAEEKAEIRRAAADAEARLRAEMEVWRRRAHKAEAKLLEACKHGSQASKTLLQALAEVHSNVPRPISAVRRVPSTPAPAVDERNLMDKEIEVVDLTSDDEDVPLVEQGDREEAASSELVSRKRKKH